MLINTFSFTNSKFAKHPHYMSYQTSQDRNIPDNGFRLKHYAGDVTYKVEGFLEKNKDTLYNDIVLCLTESGLPALKEMFPPPENLKKRPVTASFQFKNALASLMDKLLACEPHYIRCIKPNDDKKPNFVNEERVRHQVRYLGLLENVRVRRAGFAFRQHYTTFLWRYKMIAKETWPGAHITDLAGATKQIFMAHKIKEEGYRLGKTKVFIRNPTTVKNKNSYNVLFPLCCDLKNFFL